PRPPGSPDRPGPAAAGRRGAGGRRPVRRPGPRRTGRRAADPHPRRRGRRRLVPGGHGLLPRGGPRRGRRHRRRLQRGDPGGADPAGRRPEAAADPRPGRAPAHVPLRRRLPADDRAREGHHGHRRGVDADLLRPRRVTRSARPGDGARRAVRPRAVRRRAAQRCARAGLRTSPTCTLTAATRVPSITPATLATLAFTASATSRTTQPYSTAMARSIVTSSPESSP